MSATGRGERISKRIDRWSDRLGRAVAWLTLTMILVGAYNALARYLDRYTGWNLSSNAYLDLQWWMFSLVFLLGASYTLRTDSHVRVDVLYGRFSPRTKAWIDLLGSLVFLIPFCATSAWLAIPYVRNSWLGDGSPDPGGLPRAPIKTFIVIAFGLLIVQGVSQAIKAWAALRDDGPEGEAESSHAARGIG